MTTVEDCDMPAFKQSEGFPLLFSTHTKLTKMNTNTPVLFCGSHTKTIRYVMQPSTCGCLHMFENEGITFHSVKGWVCAFGQPQNMLIFMYCNKKSTLQGVNAKLIG